MKKENPRITISKRLMKNALLELLKEKEIGKISITELCARAGINRATFYRHYKLPQDLLLDIETELVERLQNIAPLPTSIKGSKPYLERLFTYIYENAEVIRILIQANTENNLPHILDKYNHVLLENMVHMTDGSHLKESDITLISAYLGGGGYYLVRAWLLYDMEKTPEEIAQFAFELLTRDLDSYIIG